jgi:hypothetical protein
VEAKIGWEEEAMAAIKFYMQSAPLKEWFGLTAPVPMVSDIKMGDTNLAEMSDRIIEAYPPEWYREDLDLAA